MVERQDIDALLIGALYGELTPAEEQQLTAHLETHPADRTALEGLTQVRQTLHQSRLLQVQLDPPQSVSALLLQEAARRAPKVKVAPAEGEGWFARFVRSFVQHPAMAAAAMLVLVVGFAAIVGRNKGAVGHDTTVESAPSAHTTQTTEAREVAQAAGSASLTERDFIAPSAAPAAEPAPIGGEGGAPSPEPAQAMDDSGAKPVVTGAVRGGDTDSYKVDLAQNAFEKQKRAAKKDAPSDGLIVERKPLAPREYEAPPAKASAKGGAGPVSDRLEERGELAYGSSGGAAPGAVAPAPAPPPPPPSSAATMSPDYAKAPRRDSADDAKLADKASETRSFEAKAEIVDPDAGWARTQHTSLVAAVNANDCTRAATIALAIEARAPGYYTANVATDRSTKNCQPTIAAVREKKEAELVARKRALEEPAKASKPAATKKAAPAKKSGKTATESR